MVEKEDNLVLCLLTMKNEKKEKDIKKKVPFYEPLTMKPFVCSHMDTGFYGITNINLSSGNVSAAKRANSMQRYNKLWK